jgi:hypothetical protein
MPLQFLLLGFGHQSQQFILVWLEQYRSLPRDLLGGIGRSHPNQRIVGPQTGDQFGKQARIFGHDCRYLVSAANRPSITAAQKSEYVLSRHRAG